MHGIPACTACCSKTSHAPLPHSQRLGALGSGSFSSCDVDGTAASEDGGGGAEDGVAVLLLGYFQSMELEGLPKHGGRLLLHHAPSA